jgi:hypothetical protein|tara:strand:+ start:2017 stop:2682 length:666 start_codon:yes stop_codon:yes gene_type:complete
MKISSETINILKNFSGINANLVFKPGKELKTISEAKTIMANASILEDFPVEFGVYDLNEFLSLFSLMDDPEVDFSDKFLTMSDGSQRIKYYYSEIEILTQPSKDINMPECEVVLDLSSNNLDKIRKAAAVLGHSELAFSCQGGEVAASVFNDKDATANTFDISLGTTSDLTFNYVFSISNLKMLQGDYKLSISSRLISNWRNADNPLDYFIALEKSSSFGV